MTSLRAVLFDIDGTLARSSSAHLSALAATAVAQLSVPAHFDIIAETPYLNGVCVAGWIDSQCFRLLADQAALEVDLAAITRLYVSAYRELLAEGAHPGDLIDGAGEALEALTRRGLTLALTTGNAAGVAEAKLARMGIGSSFTFDPDAGFGDWRANRAAIVPAALAHVGLEPGTRAALVGDTAADMRAAGTHGLTAIGVTTGAANGAELWAAGADVVLDSVADLPAALDALE